VRKLSSLALGLGVGLTAASVAGCSASHAVNVGNAFVPLPSTAGTTTGYLEIRNNGAADELTSVQTSAGGTVALRAPVGATSTMAMHSVPDIAIPAHSTVHLAPNGYHLLITGVHGLQGGKAITLTLRFAHAGKITAIALVTDPGSGGSSYFLI
jgi:copper(I)-binding protein